MDKSIISLQQLIANSGMKVTPQRLAVFEAVMSMRAHPTADAIIARVQEQHPHIAVGTIYNVLDALVDKKLIVRVKTDKDSMRYDAVLDDHHHLYCSQTGEIVDYYNQELSLILTNYFKERGIPNFEIKDIKLQINGIYKPQ